MAARGYCHLPILCRTKSLVEKVQFAWRSIRIVKVIVNGLFGQDRIFRKLSGALVYFLARIRFQQNRSTLDKKTLPLGIEAGAGIRLDDQRLR